MNSQLSIENRDDESALVHRLYGVLNVVLHDAPTRWVTVGELLVELVFGLARGSPRRAHLPSVAGTALVDGRSAIFNRKA